MSDAKQTSDAAQTGPGFSSKYNPKMYKADSIAPTGNTTSGSSQSDSRGKDNQSR